MKSKSIYLITTILYLLLSSCQNQKTVKLKYYLYNRDYKTIKKLVTQNPSLLKRKNCIKTRCNVYEYYTIIDSLAKHPYKSEKEDAELLEFLIKKGAEIDYKNYVKYYVNPLAEAIKSKRFTIAKTLIENGANIEDVDYNLNSALMIAAKIKNSSNFMKYLIKKGANINHKNKNSLNALDFALQVKDNSENINFLLSQGTEYNSSTVKNAIFDKNNLNTLLLHGINIIYKSKYMQNIPLKDNSSKNGLTVSLNPFTDSYKIKLKKIKNFDLKNYYKTFEEIKYYLKKTNADINIGPEDHLRKIHQIFLTNDSNFIKKALDLCFKNNKNCKKIISQSTYIGLTPLMQTIIQDNSEVLNYLLTKCINPDKQNKLGLTALHLAIILKKQKFSDILISYGANTGLKDIINNTQENLYKKLFNKEIERSQNHVYPCIEKTIDNETENDKNIKKEDI